MKKVATQKKKSNNVHMTRRNLKDLERNNDNLTQVKGRQGLLIQGRKVTQVTNAKEWGQNYSTQCSTIGNNNNNKKKSECEQLIIQGGRRSLGYGVTVQCCARVRGERRNAL